MIELINEDYADFVNLSTNLVGLDKCILRLKEPLLKHQVLHLATDDDTENQVCQKIILRSSTGPRFTQT